MDYFRHHLVVNKLRISDISDDFECDYRDDDYENDNNILKKMENVNDALISLGADVDPKEYCFNGLVMYTTEDPIIVAIDAGRRCCEKFGVYCEYPNNTTKMDFIGAVITNVIWGKDIRDSETEYNSTEIIIETSRGSFSIIVYNEHNGYYSHRVYAVFNKLITRFKL